MTHGPHLPIFFFLLPPTRPPPLHLLNCTSISPHLLSIASTTSSSLELDPMGKKGGLTSLFSRLAVAAADSPSCAKNPPHTASFRGFYYVDEPCTTAGGGGGGRSPAAGRLRKGGDEMYKTVNSVFFDDSADAAHAVADGCAFSGEDDDDDDRFSTTTAAEEEWSEAVIRSLGRRTSTDRFFFDAGPGRRRRRICRWRSGGRGCG